MTPVPGARPSRPEAASRLDRASRPAGASRPDRVDRRTLNRTLLARQRLHPRAPDGASALDTITHLVGLQAQDPKAPYVGLWSRQASFDHAELGTAIVDRTAVRLATLRGTVHLHTAVDAHPLRAWTQPVVESPIRLRARGSWAEVDRVEFLGVVEQLLQPAPMAAGALGQALHERWPHITPADLQQLARALVPLVQVPPRGVWGRSGATTYAVAHHWLTGPAEPVDPETLVRRYLAAYGPASVRDVQAWSGLTRLGDVVARMDLRRYVDDDGVELVDADLPLVDGATDVPPLFIAPFDNLTLSHADRRRVIDEPGRKLIASNNGIIPGLVLIDGFMAGAWRIEGSELQVTPLRTVSQRASSSLRRPGRRLLRFVTGADGDVRVRPVT